MNVLGNWVAVKQNPPEKKSTILEIPDIAVEESLSGVVVGVGNKSSVMVGDEVLFSKFDFEKVQTNEGELLFIRDEQLKLIMRK